MIENSSKRIDRSYATETNLSFLVTEPIHWLALSLFLNISGVTDYVYALKSLESVVFGIGLLTTGLYLLLTLISNKDSKKLKDIHPIFVAFGFGIVSCSIFSTFIASGSLDIINHGGWKHFAKFIVSTSVFLMLYKPGEHAKLLNTAIYAGLAVLAVSVLYRFFVLGQVHIESGRMALQGRHGDPNFACMYMTIGFIFAAINLKNAWRLWTKLLHLVLALLFVTTAWFTESRGGLVVLFSAILAVIFLIPWNFSKKRAVAVVLVGACLALVLFGSRLVHRFATIDDASNIGRLAGIMAAKDMVIEQPIWGSGFASSHNFLETHFDVLFRSSRIALEIHTTQLQIASELGLIGLIVYGSLFLNILFYAYRKMSGETETRNLAVMYGLITLSVLANMLSIPLTYTGTVYGIALVILHNLGEPKIIQSKV